MRYETDIHISMLFSLTDMGFQSEESQNKFHAVFSLCESLILSEFILSILSKYERNSLKKKCIMYS